MRVGRAITGPREGIRAVTRPRERIRAATGYKMSGNEKKCAVTGDSAENIDKFLLIVGKEAFNIL